MTLDDLRESSRTDGKKQLHETAVNIGVSWQALDNYLRGRTQLGPKSLKKLADFLRVDARELPKKLDRPEARRERKLEEPSVPYRTKPNLKAGVVYRRLPTSVLIDELAGLLKDEGVTVEDRIENSDALYNEIKRRLQASNAGVSSASPVTPEKDIESDLVKVLTLASDLVDAKPQSPESAQSPSGEAVPPSGGASGVSSRPPGAR